METVFSEDHVIKKFMLYFTYNYDYIINISRLLYYNYIAYTINKFWFKNSNKMTLFRAFWNPQSQRWGSFFTKMWCKNFWSICWCVTFSWILMMFFKIWYFWNLLYGLFCMHWIRLELFFIFRPPRREVTQGGKQYVIKLAFGTLVVTVPLLVLPVTAYHSVWSRFYADFYSWGFCRPNAHKTELFLKPFISVKNNTHFRLQRFTILRKDTFRLKILQSGHYSLSKIFNPSFINNNYSNHIVKELTSSNTIIRCFNTKSGHED